MLRHVLSLLIATATVLTATAHDHRTTIIAGSSTVYSAVFRDHLPALQLLIPHTLDVQMSSSGRGLAALANGDADIGMISSPLDVLVKKMSTEVPAIAQQQFNVHNLGALDIHFVVHPNNPVQNITYPQALSIMAGEITHWSELGHPELGKIQVITEHPSGGIYNFIETKLLKERSITTNITPLPHAPLVAKVVSQLPASFGFLSSSVTHTQRFGVRTIAQTPAEIQQPLLLVTRQDYFEKSPEQAVIIDIIQKYMDNLE